MAHIFQVSNGKTGEVKAVFAAGASWEPYPNTTAARYKARKILKRRSLQSLSVYSLACEKCEAAATRLVSNRAYCDEHAEWAKLTPEEKIEELFDKIISLRKDVSLI